ncbi:unnamed protein product [Lampetra fluviatilis]
MESAVHDEGTSCATPARMRATLEPIVTSSPMHVVHLAPTTPARMPRATKTMAVTDRARAACKRIII